MKKLQRLTALLGALLLTAGLCAPALAASPTVEVKALTVLFTHDTHDHFLPDAADVGGYTRLATLLYRERESAQGPVVTLDGGDFSMGSFLQTVFATDAPELRALGYMGYDVTTLGNHEFDYRPQGLAHMLNVAKKAREAGEKAAFSSASGDLERYREEYGPLTLSLPAIVQANYRTPKDPSDPAARALVEAMDNYPVTDYTVLQKEGLRIAVFGVMGVDSDECTPMSGMTLTPAIDAAKRVVAEIREKEAPDYIICLSHSGTEKGKGEDYELAKAVDGIDLIISGHTHTTLPEPIVVNDTVIASCGPYTRNLGKVKLSKTVSGGGSAESVKVDSYELIPIDASVPANAGMAGMVEQFKKRVNENYLSNYGLEYEQVLARSERDYTVGETGDLIGQAYISTLKELEGESYVPIAFAVAPDGVIRDVIRQGDVTTDNAFTILSLGVGADGTPGYPLVSVYLTGKDLKNTFEVDASVSAIMPAATLYGAGSRWCLNPHRMFLDRVFLSKVSLRSDGSGEPLYEDIDDNALYRVVADLYSGQMLSTVKGKSFGLLSITPRDAQGNEIADFEECIIHDADGNEVKAWYALAAHLKDTGRIDTPWGSKMISKSWAPWDLVWPMGAPTAAVLAVLVLLVLAIALIVRCIVRRRRKNQGYRAYRGR